MSGKPIYFNNESNTFYPQGKKALLCKAKHVKFKEFNDFGKNFIEELITFVRQDELQKVNIEKIIAYIDDTLLKEETVAQAKQTAEELKKGQDSFYQVELSLQMEQGKLKSIFGNPAEREPIGRVFFTYCHRIRHLYTLVWKTFQDRIALAAQIIIQISTIEANKSKVVRPSTPTLPIFKVKK